MALAASAVVAAAAAVALAMCGSGPDECPFFLLFFYLHAYYIVNWTKRGP